MKKRGKRQSLDAGSTLVKYKDFLRGNQSAGRMLRPQAIQACRANAGGITTGELLKQGRRHSARCTPTVKRTFAGEGVATDRAGNYFRMGFLFAGMCHGN